MRFWRSRHKAVFLLLLSLLTAANTSHGIVLCIGPGGHVAIEPAGHTHCCGPTHGHEANAGPAHAVLRHASDSHCCPCTDIPISAGTCEDQIVSRASRVDLPDPAALPAFGESGWDNSGFFALPAITAFPTASHLALRSIVLQV